MADSVDIKLFEDAIRAAVLAGSGLTDGQVIFRDQYADAPAGEYVTVATDGPETIGWQKAVSQSFDAGQVGQEVGLSMQGPAEMRVALQGYSGPTTGDGNAQATLQKVKMYLQTPSARAVLNAAGIGIFDFGKVQRIPRVYGASMEGRASLELRCYVNESVVDRAGYITQVDGGAPDTPPAAGWTPPGSGPTGTFS